MEKRIVWPGWEVVRLIGNGSFGSVYEIQRDLYGNVEKAALKVITIPQSRSDIEELYNDGYDDESITIRFRSYLQDIVREYSLMAEMKGHTNVVYCDDLRQIQHEDGIGWDIYIKMELLTPLTKALGKEISEEQVIRIGMDICNALVLCKERNIVHRDIKPQNIFVSKDGNYKLGDFGIAKTAERTTSGTKIGTYKYMAPEVYKTLPYGSSADIYSLGLVLYWLLNERRTPFLPLPPQTPSASTEDEARKRRFTGETIPVPAHGSKELQAVVLKACAYDPKDRFKSAAEMLEALKAVKANDSVAVATVLAGATAVGSAAAIAAVGKEQSGTAAAMEEDATLRAFPPADVQIKNAPVNPSGKEIKQKQTVQTMEPPVLTATPSNRNSKKKKGTFALLAAVCAVLSVALGLWFMLSRPDGGAKGTTTESKTESDFKENSTPMQLEWTDWSDELPDYVSEKDYLIEEQTLYSSRKLETTTSTDGDQLEGWELYETAAGNGDYGPWSDWSQNAVSGTDLRQVETQTQYRSSDKETTTGNAPSMSGWELYDTTYTWGDYGSWSDWSTSASTASDSRQVETKTQYRYRNISYATEYTDWGAWSDWRWAQESGGDLKQEESRTVWGYCYFQCAYCGAHMHGYGSCWTWAGGCGRATSPYDGTGVWHEVWSTVSWNDAGLKDWHGTGKYYTYINGELVFKWPESGSPKTQYRYRTRSTQQVANYGSWSNWEDTAYSSSSSREVENRTVYRYRDRSQVATYHFYRWGDWSGWKTDAISANNDRKVEKATFYRYRDRATQTTYYFRRWTDWSDFTQTPVDASDTVEVRTKKQYRFKSKSE